MNETYEEFRAAWIGDIISGEQSSTEKGRVFALKIIHQWLNLDAETDEENDNLFYCDGSGDGGIDVAYLRRGDAEVPGDTWYLVQSKYGTAFQGETMLISEGRKVIETLQGERVQLSSLVGNVLERLKNFRASMGEGDKIVLVFAAIDPLSKGEKQALEDVRAIAKERLPFSFDVEAISLRTIYDRLGEELVEVRVPLSLEVPNPELKAELLVGTVALPDIYQFLRDFKAQRNDLDLLYAKNVRLYLSTAINKTIVKTLKESPELFGFYNNGVTIVVSDYIHKENALELIGPSVVNGCQTTRSIYEVFDQKLNAGGTGKKAELRQWQTKADDGRVIVKIVRVAPGGEGEFLKNIVLYTNSQNAVKSQDFLALQTSFKTWQDAMEQHGIYLEIQRGGIDALKARQKKGASKIPFDASKVANAFELIKVYCAAWLGEPGPAWGKSNRAFSPDGDYYERVMKADFGVPDLLECFYLQKAADGYDFSVSGKKAIQTRRISRFLFYFVTLELLRRLLKLNSYSADAKTCTQALQLLREANREKLLHEAALQVVDAYMNPGNGDSVVKEPSFETQFGGNLNNYLKSEKFAKDEEVSPKLWQCLKTTQTILSMKLGDNAPHQEQIADTWKKKLKTINPA